MLNRRTLVKAIYLTTQAKDYMKKNNRKTSTSKRSQSQRSRRSSEDQGNMETDLHELFLDDLADVYNAENQLVKALPKLARAAQTPELKEAFELHFRETQQQAKRIEQVARLLGESLKRKKCKGMEGLIEEGKEMMEEMEDSSALDAALIGAAQKVEHYEIATYGTLCTWAELMGHDQALQLLKRNLSEEEATDEKLSQIAESVANVKAQR